jgi:hypothetical protein
MKAGQRAKPKADRSIIPDGIRVATGAGAIERLTRMKCSLFSIYRWYSSEPPASGFSLVHVRFFVSFGQTFGARKVSTRFPQVLWKNLWKKHFSTLQVNEVFRLIAFCTRRRQISQTV